MSKLESIYWRHAEWSERTFGTAAMKGPRGPLLHLKKEADEAIANTSDPHEFADCLFLVFDAARRAGHDFDALVKAANEKLAILETRTYRQTDPNAPCEHDRSEASS